MTFQKKASTELLHVLLKVVFEVIVQTLSGTEYRQGNTPGQNFRHWRRAKLGTGRYRLFFRYRKKDKIIDLPLMNDESTLRTCGSEPDANRVFRKMLTDGHPPYDREVLMKASEDCSTFVQRLRVIGGK